MTPIRECRIRIVGLHHVCDIHDRPSGCPERLRQSALTPGEIERLLGRSDSYAIAAAAGEPIMIPPTGNNLRDLFLMARG